MRKTLLILLTLFASVLSVSAASMVKRDTLMGVPYTIYLPQNYYLQPTVQFPCLYLQHGMFGNERDWLQDGWLKLTLDSLISHGLVREMVVIMPDNFLGSLPDESRRALMAAPAVSPAGDTLDFSHGTAHWAKLTREEEQAYEMSGYWEEHFPAFMYACERKFRLEQTADSRAIAGLSMGGFHTMHISHYMPDAFGYVGLFSAVILPHREYSFADNSGFRRQQHYGSPVYDSWMKQVREQASYEPVYWIGIGSDDFLYEQLTAYRQWLDKNNITYTYHESAGGHTWDNWRDYLLLFLPECFTPRQMTGYLNNASSAFLQAERLETSAHQDLRTRHRLATYNIRVLTDADTDSRNWDQRKFYLARLIYKMQPDVLGLQEIRLGKQEQDLRDLLPDYTLVVWGRDSAEVSRGEACGVAFRTDRYTVLDTSHFFLTPDPKVPGKAWDAACPRVAVYARLQDKISGKTFAFCSTHLDHIGVQARAKGAKVIQRELKKLDGKEPMIVVGDMNAIAGTKEGKNIVNSFRPLRDSYELTEVTPVGAEGTWASWVASHAKDRIDYLFVRGVDVQAYYIYPDDFGRRVTPSDHLPSLIEVAF